MDEQLADVLGERRVLVLDDGAGDDGSAGAAGLAEVGLRRDEDVGDVLGEARVPCLRRAAGCAG